MFTKDMQIEGFDDEIFSAIEEENRRQEQHIELIASENYASPRVMQAQGTSLTNKYAEGYPGKRYYGGCEYVDKLKTWRLSGLRRCLVPIMPMFSRTRVLRLTQRFIWRYYSPETQC